MKSPIYLIVPQPDIDPGDDPVTPLFISPDGADPNREVPGFFIIQIDGEPVWPGDGSPPEKDVKQPIPRQFLSLDAVHAFLLEHYGWKVPLHVTSYIKTPDTNKFPAVWSAERRLNRKKVLVRSRYLGSFRYWDGRPVHPTKVGTKNEFN